MEKETKEKLEELLSEAETGTLFSDNSTWVILILMLTLLMPQKQEPPVVNIFVGDDK